MAHDGQMLAGERVLRVQRAVVSVVLAAAAVSCSSSSDNAKGDATTSSPSETTDTGDTTPTETPETGDAGQTSPKVRFTGTVRVALGPGTHAVDFDATPPLVASSVDGKDISIGPDSDFPGLQTGNANLIMTWLRDPGPAPSEAECSEQIRKDGLFHSRLTRGSRFCVQTTEGRVAYLERVDTPDQDPMQLTVTVWEKP